MRVLTLLVLILSAFAQEERSFSSLDEALEFLSSSPSLGLASEVDLLAKEREIDVLVNESARECLEVKRENLKFPVIFKSTCHLKYLRR